METRKPYPSDLTDAQFELISSHLPKEKKTGRKPTISRREILNAILYKVKTGCQWNALPHDLPNHKTVYTYFTWWTLEGRLDAILTSLREAVRIQEGREATPSAAIIDSQSVKTTAYGGEDGSIGVDGHKRVNGRKRHVLVDTLGLLLAVVVTAANLPDREGARQLACACTEFPRLVKIWVDGSYTGDVKALYADQHQIDFEIVEKPADQKGFAVSPKRWVVERTFAWLGWYRGLSRDYEYCPRHSESTIKLAQIHMMIRRLKPPQEPDDKQNGAIT
jgi:putative transposase